MKKIFVIIILLLLLIACNTPKTALKPTEPENTTELSKTGILALFSKLDSELNTSWREEEIPTNMINIKAIEPWTANMVFLKDRLATKNDSVLQNLVDARIDMLKSQLSYYLMLEVGEKGIINMTQLDKKFTPAQEIDCKNAKIIAKSLGLFDASHKAWKNFSMHLDEALQNDLDLRKQLGDSNRPKFYNSLLDNVPEYTAAAQKTVYNQCEIEIVIQ